MYNITFDGNIKIVLDKYGLKFLSEKWFICSGSVAFYFKYIKSISYKTYSSRFGVGYKATVKTNDSKKYSFWIGSVSDIKKVRDWVKNTKESELVK